MFQILDFILFGIMLVSGLLAVARGLTRELLSLVAWGAAAAAAWYASKQKPLLDLVLPHVDPNKPVIAQIVVAAAAFILVLIIVSVIGVKISDRVVDSTAGPFDRTLGFLFGLARGLVLVAVCLGFYVYFVPTEKQEDWIRNAVSLPTLTWTKDTLLSLIPQEWQDSVSSSNYVGNLESPAQGDGKGLQADQNADTNKAQQQGMSTLSKGAAEQPAIGQDQGQ